MEIKEWIGFDFDGTIAIYNGWGGELEFGEPIPVMIELIRGYLKSGYTVKIFTGSRLEATCIKDLGLRLFYDDRAVQVIPNTGITVENGGM